jgi:Tfp pilus assembly protein PilF
MLLRCCLLACILGFSLAAEAQMMPHPAPVTLQVNGQIRYSPGGRPAEIVLVRLEFFGGGEVGEATTDRNGKFRFADLAGALYIVSVRVPGFREVQQQVDLRTQLTDFVELQLVANLDGLTSSTNTKTAGVVDANIPNNAAMEFQKGKAALLEAHNLDEGIAHLEKAVLIYPKYSAALLLLGTAYMDQRQWDKAEATLRHVLAIEPKATAAHLALGELYLDQKKYSESTTELLLAINLDPKSSRGHLTLGRLYYEIGDLAKAGPQVGMALQIDPALAEGHLLAGNILLRAHQPENALAEFEEYLRLEPNGQFAEEARRLAQRIKQRPVPNKTNP